MTSWLYSSSHGAAWPCHSAASACGTVEIAIEDDDLPRAGVGEVVQRFLGHLAGADHEHALVVEPLEDARRRNRRSPRWGCSRDGGAASVSLATRRATRMADLEEAVRHGAGAADLPGQLVGLFHLRKDLRFAEDHAVEAGGDAEQVADDLLAFERHEFAADFLDRHVVEVGQVLA